jgi:hypothetical protein
VQSRRLHSSIDKMLSMWVRKMMELCRAMALS